MKTTSQKVYDYLLSKCDKTFVDARIDRRLLSERLYRRIKKYCIFEDRNVNLEHMYANCSVANIKNFNLCEVKRCINYNYLVSYCPLFKDE